LSSYGLSQVSHKVFGLDTDLGFQSLILFWGSALNLCC